MAIYASGWIKCQTRLTSNPRWANNWRISCTWYVSNSIMTLDNDPIIISNQICLFSPYLLLLKTTIFKEWGCAEANKAPSMGWDLSSSGNRWINKKTKAGTDGKIKTKAGTDGEIKTKWNAATSQGNIFETVDTAVKHLRSSSSLS